MVHQSCLNRCQQKDLAHLFTCMTPWCSWQLWKGSFGRQHGWDQHHLSDNLLIRASSVEVMLPSCHSMLAVFFCNACQIVSAPGSFRRVFLAHLRTGVCPQFWPCLGWQHKKKKNNLKTWFKPRYAARDVQSVTHLAEEGIGFFYYYFKE